MKQKGNNCVYNYPLSDWLWAKKNKNTDYHVKNEDEVDESENSQRTYIPEHEHYMISIQNNNDLKVQCEHSGYENWVSNNGAE